MVDCGELEEGGSVESKRRIRVGLLFGGRSPEHEVSITTAASIAKEADPERLEIVPIWITREGRWVQLRGAPELASLAGHLAAEQEVGRLGKGEVLLSGAATASLVPIAPLTGSTAPAPIDVLFPALHGLGGEDGSVQGLARLANVPCVGAGILGSALGMDKVSMKRVVAALKIPIPAFVAFTRAEWEKRGASIREEIDRALRLPYFVKPSQAGSSVGISKVADVDRLSAAVTEAARFDYRILIEQGIDARELEVGVLGNDEPQASVVGEIIPSREFYDYRDKYLEDGSRVAIPADIPAETAEQARSLATGAFRALDLAGMARADFLLDRGIGKLYFNEVNTIPGFTPISMYPMLWSASGVPYRELISRLVDLAIERHRETRVETVRPEG
jgi:D-alanine-D-alanine ligase